MNRCFLVSFVAVAVLLASQPSVVDAAHVAQVDATSPEDFRPNPTPEEEEAVRAKVINPDMKHVPENSVFEVVESVMKAQREAEDAAKASAPAQKKVEDITAANASLVDEPGSISPVVEGPVVEEGSSTQILDAPRISSELLPDIPVIKPMEEAAASVHEPTQDMAALSQGDSAGGGSNTSAEVGAESGSASSANDTGAAAAKEALASCAAKAKAAGVSTDEVMAVAAKGADIDSTQDSKAAEESSESSSEAAIGSQEKLQNTKAHAVALGERIVSASPGQLAKFVCSDDPDILSMTKCVKNNIGVAMDAAAAKIAKNDCPDPLYMEKKKEEPKAPCDDIEAQWIGEDMAERALYGNGVYSDIDPPLHSDLPRWTMKDKDGQPIQSPARAPSGKEVLGAAVDGLKGSGGSAEEADNLKKNVADERQDAFGGEDDYKRVLNGESSDFANPASKAKSPEASGPLEVGIALTGAPDDGGVTEKGNHKGAGPSGITLNGKKIGSLADSSTAAVLSTAAVPDEKAAAAKKVIMDAGGSQEVSQKVGEIVQKEASKVVQLASELSDIEEGLV